jgi:hypothetical protein
MWYNDSDYLPPGCTPDDVDAALGAFYSDVADDRDDRLDVPGEHGLCVPCAAEGYAVPAMVGRSSCVECVECFPPECAPCRGYGTLDGRPEGALVNGAWRYRGAPPCPHCAGTGNATVAATAP